MIRDWGFYNVFMMFYLMRLIILQITLCRWSNRVWKDYKSAQKMNCIMDGFICGGALLEQVITGWKPCEFDITNYAIDAFYMYWLLFCAITAYGIGACAGFTYKYIKRMRKEKAELKRENVWQSNTRRPASEVQEEEIKDQAQV